MKRLLLLLAISFLFSQLSCRSVENEPIKSCRGFTCPEGSTLCKRITRTTPDKKNLLVEVQCLGSNGEVLMANKTKVDNPFGEGSSLTAISISGVYTVANPYGFEPVGLPPGVPTEPEAEIITKAPKSLKEVDDLAKK